MEENKGIFDIGDLKEDTDDVSSNGFSLSFDDLAEDTSTDDIKDIKESSDVSHIQIEGSADTIPVTSGTVINTLGESLFDLDSLSEDTDTDSNTGDVFTFDDDTLKGLGVSFDNLEEDTDTGESSELFTLDLDGSLLNESLHNSQEDSPGDISISDYIPSELLDSFMNTPTIEEEDEVIADTITDEGIVRAFSLDLKACLDLQSHCESESAVVKSKGKVASIDGVETIMDKYFSGSYLLLSNLVQRTYTEEKANSNLEGVVILQHIKSMLYTYNLVEDSMFNNKDEVKKITGEALGFELFDVKEVLQYLHATLAGKKANINTYKLKIRHDKGLSYTVPKNKLYDIAQMSGLIAPVPGVPEDRPIEERLFITGYTRDMIQPFSDLSLSDFISEGEYELLFKSLTATIRKSIELEQESLATRQLEDSSRIKKERDLAYTDSDIFKQFKIDANKGEVSTEDIVPLFTLFKDINVDNSTFTCGSCGEKNVPFTGSLYEVKRLMPNGTGDGVTGYNLPKLCNCGKYNLLSAKVQESLLDYGKRFLYSGTTNIGLDKIGGVALTLELPKSTVKHCIGLTSPSDEIALDLDTNDKAISSDIVSRKEFFFDHLDALESYKNLKNYYKSYALDSTTLTAGIMNNTDNFTGNVLLDNIISKQKMFSKLSKTEQLVLDYAKGVKLSDADREIVDNYRTSNGDVLETSGDYLAKDLKQLAMYVCELTGTVYSEIKQQALDTILTTLKDFRLDSKLDYVAYTQSLVYKSALPYLRGLDVTNPTTLKVLTFYTSRTNTSVLTSKVVDGCITNEYLNKVLDKVEVKLDNTIDNYTKALSFIKDNYDRFIFIPIQGSTEIDMSTNGDILSIGEVKDLLYLVSDKMIVLAKAVDLFKMLPSKQSGAQAVDLSKMFPSIYRDLMNSIKEDKPKFVTTMLDTISGKINSNKGNTGCELIRNNTYASIDGGTCKLYNLPVTSKICESLFTEISDGSLTKIDVTAKDIKSIATEDTIASTLKYLFTAKTLRSLNISNAILTEIKIIIKHFMDGNYISYVNSIVKLKDLVSKEVNSSNSSLYDFRDLYTSVSKGLNSVDLDTPSDYVLRGLFEAVTYLDYDTNIERTLLNRLYYVLGGQFDKEDIYIYLDEISKKSKFITDRLYKKLPGQSPISYVNNYKVLNKQYILSYFKDVILNSEDRVSAEKIILDYFDMHGFLVGYFDIPLENSIPVKSLNEYLKSHYIPNTLLKTYVTNKFINKLYTEDYKYIMKMKILSDMSDFAIRHDDTIILSKVMFDIIYTMENFADISLIDFLNIDKFNIDRINNDVKDFSLNSDTLDAICDILINIYYNDNTLDLNIILDSEFKNMSSSFKALALAFTQEECDGEVRVLLDKSDILNMIGFTDTLIVEGINKVFSILEEHEDDLKGFIDSLR